MAVGDLAGIGSAPLYEQWGPGCELVCPEDADEISPYEDVCTRTRVIVPDFALVWAHVEVMLLAAAVLWGVLAACGLSYGCMSGERRVWLKYVLGRIEFNLHQNPYMLVLMWLMPTVMSINWCVRSAVQENNIVGLMIELVAASCIMLEMSLLMMQNFTLSQQEGLVNLVTGVPRDCLICASTFLMLFLEADVPVARRARPPLYILQAQAVEQGLGLITEDDVGPEWEQRMVGRPTWFSFGFLAAIRAAATFRRLLNVLQGGQTPIKWQIAVVLADMLSSIYIAAALMMALETLGDPSMLEEYNRREWTLLSSLYFIFVTISTVGYGDMYPMTGLGRAVVICTIFGGMAQFSTAVNQIVQAWRLKQSGHGSYVFNGVLRHVVVCGNPSGQMLKNFVAELFHPDHAEDCADLALVVMLPHQGPAMDALVNFMKRKENLHIVDRVTVLVGSVLDPYDLKRVLIEKAEACYVLPNISRPDPVQDDLESIVRVLAIRRQVSPMLQIIVLLHRAMHRELLAARPGELTEALAIDQLKLELIGKATMVPGFATLVCNLCKTWSKATNEEVTREWQKQYDLGLGCELYEVKLSTSYQGMTFATVVSDILDKAVKKDVYLLGLVELEDIREGAIYQKKQIARHLNHLREKSGRNRLPRDISHVFAGIGAKGSATGDEAGAFMHIPGGRRKRVLLNPGAEYRLRAENYVETYGVFIATDRASINQPDDLDDPPPEEEEELDLEEVDEKLAKFQKEALNREKMLAQGGAAAQMKEMLTREDMHLAPNERARKAIENMLVNQKITPVLAELQPNIAKLEVMDGVTQQGRKPPPASVPKLIEGGHILLITFSRDPSFVLGLEHFVHPIRHAQGASGVGPPIFVFGPCKPADWYTIVGFQDVYFLQGDPFLIFDLERANFERAKIVFVTAHSSPNVTDPAMADADAIFCVRMLEAEMQQRQLRDHVPGDPLPPLPTVIAELAFDANFRFIPLPAQNPETGVHGMSFVEEKDSDKLSNAASGLRFAGGAIGVTARRFSAMNSGQKGFGTNRQDKEAADGAADSSDYYRHPRFACGQLFVSSIVTSLSVNTLFNPSLARLIGEMIHASIVMVQVSAEWEQKTYHDFFLWLLKEKNLLAIGIYRTVDMAAEAGRRKGGGAFLKQMARQTGRARRLRATVRESADIPNAFVYTAPAAQSNVMHLSDRVICLVGRNPAGSQNLQMPQPFRMAIGDQPPPYGGQQAMPNPLAMPGVPGQVPGVGQLALPGQVPGVMGAPGMGQIGGQMPGMPGMGQIGGQMPGMPGQIGGQMPGMPGMPGQLGGAMPGQMALTNGGAMPGQPLALPGAHPQLTRLPLGNGMPGQPMPGQPMAGPGQGMQSMGSSLGNSMGTTLGHSMGTSMGTVAAAGAPMSNMVPPTSYPM